MAKLPNDDVKAHPLADIDPLVHAPARLMILTYLSVVESADFVFLKRLTKLSWGNLSTHLTKLEKAGMGRALVVQDGRLEGLISNADVAAWLDRYQQLH